ncbi:DUF3327 domain-containing protein [Kineosporia sp. J2-2]|uniref:DUF3327 domain-containing protein n=1 Tax=Kineosporia corallincola TaxID=2835133 RepID=A0ABS5TET8_9ACTN|nr:alpha/beta hydrolase-fold protein [Kineosporia corallincola]MBT0769577.1 DUF3327 domain-containing protein [Kineosporia corallincola]
MHHHDHERGHSRLMRRPVLRRDQPVTRLALPPGPVLAHRVAAEGAPLIDPDPHGDPAHRRATFVWNERGTRPGSVILHANKFTDYDDPASCALEPVPGTGLWAAAFRVPAGWRSSYRIGPLPQTLDRLGELGTGRAARAALLRHAQADPHARAGMRDHQDGSLWSVAEMPRAPGQTWVDAAAPGFLAELTVGGTPVWVHATGAPVGAILVLLDGDLWARRHPVTPTLDELTRRNLLPGLLTVLVGPSGAGRAADLTANEAYPHRLADEVLPAVLDHERVRGLGVRPSPGTTAVAGQSLGGLAAVHAAWRRPEVFGNVLAQSGSFWVQGAQDGEMPWMHRQLEVPADGPVRFRFQVGTMEWGMPAITRDLCDRLRRKGYDARLEEFCGGHDRACWRGGLGAGLVDLLGSGCLPRGDN